MQGGENMSTISLSQIEILNEVEVPFINAYLMEAVAKGKKPIDDEEDDKKNDSGDDSDDFDLDDDDKEDDGDDDGGDDDGGVDVEGDW